MPLPPPPAAALTITGKPSSRAISMALLSSVTTPLLPGSTGTPAFCAVSRALALSPICLMLSGLGPMKRIPVELQISAKLAFSARKPYPG